MKTTEAQQKATEKWQSNNKDKVKHYQYKSRAKTFINKHASIEELKELRKMIDDKIKELEN